MWHNHFSTTNGAQAWGEFFFTDITSKKVQMTGKEVNRMEGKARQGNIKQNKTGILGKGMEQKGMEWMEHNKTEGKGKGKEQKGMQGKGKILDLICFLLEHFC